MQMRPRRRSPPLPSLAFYTHSCSVCTLTKHTTHFFFRIYKYEHINRWLVVLVVAIAVADIVCSKYKRKKNKRKKLHRTNWNNIRVYYLHSQTHTSHIPKKINAQTHTLTDWLTGEQHRTTATSTFTETQSSTTQIHDKYDGSGYLAISQLIAKHNIDWFAFFF